MDKSKIADGLKRESEEIMKKTLLMKLMFIMLVLVSLLAIVSCDLTIEIPSSQTTTTSTTIPTQQICKHDDTSKVIVLEAKEPTCSEKGLTEGIKCLNCGVMVVPQSEIEKTECVESDWIVDLEPTQEQEGAQHTECIMCGRTIQEDIIERLPVIPDIPKLETYKLGMGVVFGDHTGTLIQSTVAAVVLDDEGKIVSCRLDAVYNKFIVDDDACEIVFTNLLTKAELRENYHMSAFGMDMNYDGVVLEWYQQARAFELYVVGKTAEEVEQIATTYVNGYNIAVDDELLSAGCTIDIIEFKQAIVKACNDDQSVTFEAENTFTLGVAANSEDDGSTCEDLGYYRVKMNVEFASSVVADGKIVASLNDAYQPTITVEDDEIVSINVGKDESFGLMTKRELKENYAMGGNPWSPDADNDGRVLEWYLQSKAFSNYVVGMTGTEVREMPTQLINGYEISVDYDLISAGCTISIIGMKSVVSESVENAR